MWLDSRFAPYPGCSSHSFPFTNALADPPCAQIQNLVVPVRSLEPLRLMGYVRWRYAISATILRSLLMTHWALCVGGKRQIVSLDFFYHSTSIFIILE